MALTDTGAGRAIMGLGMFTPQILPEPAVAGTFQAEDTATFLNIWLVAVTAPSGDDLALHYAESGGTSHMPPLNSMALGRR